METRKRKSPELTPEEKAKRKEQLRVASRNYRKKQKQAFISLLEENKQLSDVNNAQQAELEKQREEILRLNSIIADQNNNLVNIICYFSQALPTIIEAKEQTIPVPPKRVSVVTSGLGLMSQPNQQRQSEPPQFTSNSSYYTP